MLSLIEEELMKYSKYDWKIVVGHHQVGYTCPTGLSDT
jgi:hypothetical protein